MRGGERSGRTFAICNDELCLRALAGRLLRAWGMSIDVATAVWAGDGLRCSGGDDEDWMRLQGTAGVS